MWCTLETVSVSRSDGVADCRFITSKLRSCFGESLNKLELWCRCLLIRIVNLLLIEHRWRLRASTVRFDSEIPLMARCCGPLRRIPVLLCRSYSVRTENVC